MFQKVCSKRFDCGPPQTWAWMRGVAHPATTRSTIRPTGRWIETCLRNLLFPWHCLVLMISFQLFWLKCNCNKLCQDHAKKKKKNEEENLQVYDQGHILDSPHSAVELKNVAANIPWHWEGTQTGRFGKAGLRSATHRCEPRISACLGIKFPGWERQSVS